MDTQRTVPYATLSLAIFATVIQVIRTLGGPYEQFVLTNLHHGGWDVFYAQPWRMITSSFVHHDLPHYLGNLFFLLLFGSQIERSHGWRYVLGAFFGALITGYVVYLTFVHERIVGISGGVCGLFGFCLIANRRTPWWATLAKRPLYILYVAGLLWFGIADINDPGPNKVAHLNHVVGILYGMLFGAAFFSLPRWRWPAVALPLVLFASQFHSPWQLEWQLLNSQPVLYGPVADCRTRTVEENTPALMDIANSSDEPVAIYLMTFDGLARFSNVLRPGESISYHTAITHAWCIVDLDRMQALQAITVTETEHTVTIR